MRKNYKDKLLYFLALFISYLAGFTTAEKIARVDCLSAEAVRLALEVVLYGVVIVAFFMLVGIIVNIFFITMKERNKED